jgi:Fic family protein
MAHLNLVMIHPFRDGNGRMARCLQSLVLAREGVLSPVFMSVEEYLGRNTQGYHDVLAEVGGGSWQPQRDATIGLRVRNATYRSYFEAGSEAITDATVSRDLRQLVDADLLEPRGQKRGRFYIAQPELTLIRTEVTALRDIRDDADPSAG